MINPPFQSTSVYPEEEWASSSLNKAEPQLQRCTPQTLMMDARKALFAMLISLFGRKHLYRNQL
jgi:hypothetical protein